MEITTPVPIEVLAKMLGVSTRTIDGELSRLRKEKPAVIKLNVSKGPYDGYKKSVNLYHVDIVQFFTLRKNNTLPKKEKPEAKPKPVPKTPKAPKIPNPSTPTTNSKAKTFSETEEDHANIISVIAEEVKTDQSIEDGFFKNRQINWEAIFTLLETGATLEEVAGYLRIKQSHLTAACRNELKLSFTELRAYCYNAGNVKIRLSLYSSTIGTKERKANPLIQGLMARERLGYGIKPMEDIPKTQNLVLVDGKHVDMEAMSDEQLDELKKEAEEYEEYLKGGQSENPEIQKDSGDKGDLRENQSPPVEDPS